jgi:hypothetical protein
VIARYILAVFSRILASCTGHWKLEVLDTTDNTWAGTVVG